MARFEILHRWTGSVLFSIETGSGRFAVEAAVRSRANLSEADLSWANLNWADLSEADLSRANLSRANLNWADLSEADLSRANLSRADLSWANLSRADLSWANLSRANLSRADLSRADLSRADLSIPKIPNLDRQILAAIEAGGNLEMSSWHRCQTTHCRAGWAIYLAGDAGKALEEKIGPCAAGALIYATSAGYVPNFYATHDEAMADLRIHAAQQSQED